MILGRQDLLCSFIVLDRKHGGMTCCWKASMFTYQYAMCMLQKSYRRHICSVQHTTFCIHYRVGQKTGLFSWADNFATAIAVGRRVIRQKFPNFVFKKVSHLNVSEIKYICQVCINIQRMWNLAEFVNNAWILDIFTARRYASEVRYMLWPCVRLCLSQVGVLLKRLNAGSHNENHTIAQGL